MDCDVEIEKRYATFEPQVDVADKLLPPAKRKRKKSAGNEPNFDLRLHLYQMAGVDLTQIDGIDALTVQKVLTETGVDMSKWKTVKHFTSWLSVCPHNDKTGGKVIKSGTKKTQNRAAAALRMAAQSLCCSKSALGGYYRSMRAKLGAPEAITATAHKLACIIYAMLKNQTEYRDPGEGYYEERACPFGKLRASSERSQRARQGAIKSLERKAKKLGLKVVSIDA